MTNIEKTKEMLNASTNGIITAEQVTAAGIHRYGLQELANSGEIYRFGRGLYMRIEATYSSVLSGFELSPIHHQYL